MIIAGHTRWLASQSLGLDKVPVRYLDLDEVDAKLLAISDNSIGEIAEWEPTTLAEQLDELKAHGVDLDVTGWGEDKIEEILQNVDSLGDPLAPPEPKEAPPQPQIVDVSAEIRQGDCIELMAQMEPDSIDAIVCDPPYGIGFMGKDWDVAVPGLEWAKACYRVLKPGGHIVAFSGTRTVHRLTVAIEDAGFEIRDMVAWAQYQGFPKSLNVGLEVPEFEGYGTGLKPSYEPAVLARKPLQESSIAKQLLATGTGALNIDGCRFAYGDPAWIGPQEGYAYANGPGGKQPFFDGTPHGKGDTPVSSNPLGRWPANIYQCPKPSRGEREAGCEGLEAVESAAVEHHGKESKGLDSPRAGAGRTAESVKNNHPTVKPLGVMRWLCKLVGGQPGSLILDTFSGSGTTACAAVLEGFNAIGLEMDPRFCEIGRARIAYWSGHVKADETDA
tara:strand:- start:451 stop:1785 length:1335 start_codon:yes stop_codon:yes gene_type:complete